MPRWDDDAELIGDLRDALAEIDRVPESRRRAAHEAFAWRNVDEELLALTFDSAESPLVAMRAPDGPRVIAFEGARVSVELELGEEQILGQVLASQECEISLETADGVQSSVHTDESGFFTLPGPPRGSVRFCIALAEGSHLTPWVVL